MKPLFWANLPFLILLACLNTVHVNAQAASFNAQTAMLPDFCRKRDLFHVFGGPSYSIDDFALGFDA